MDLFIQKIDGEVLKLEGIRRDDTVRYVKAQIAWHEGIFAEQQRLIFNDVVLEDGKTLSDYDIRERSTINLVKIVKRRSRSNDTNVMGSNSDSDAASEDS